MIAFFRSVGIEIRSGLFSTCLVCPLPPIKPIFRAKPCYVLRGELLRQSPELPRPLYFALDPRLSKTQLFFLNIVLVALHLFSPPITSVNPSSFFCRDRGDAVFFRMVQCPFFFYPQPPFNLRGSARWLRCLCSVDINCSRVLLCLPPPLALFFS